MKCLCSLFVLFLVILHHKFIYQLFTKRIIIMKKILFALGFVFTCILLLAYNKERQESPQLITEIKSVEFNHKIYYFDTPIAYVTDNAVDILNREGIIDHLESRLSTNPFKKETLYDLDLIKTDDDYILSINTSLGYTSIPLIQIGEYLFEVSSVKSGLSQLKLYKDCKGEDCGNDVCIKTMLTIEGSCLSENSDVLMIYEQ